MGFRQADSEGRGGFARVWSIENKGNYTTAKLSTSKKRKDGDGYETDFQDGFVRFIGSAHDKINKVVIGEKGITIQITSCEVTSSPYNSEKKKCYTNYAVFAFNVPDGNGTTSGSKSKAATKTKTKANTKPSVDIVEEEDEDLPF